MDQQGASLDRALTFGPFSLLPARQTLLRDGRPVKLGGRALDILIALVEHGGALMTRDELVAAVWPNVFVDDSTLRVHIAALRKALGDGQGEARYVVNVSGRGYSFVAPVTRSDAPVAAASPASEADSNLPAPLTRMIGRDQIVEGLAEILPQRRFLSIVGPGGMGKTTVALAVAARRLGDYRDGACFVDLGALTDPALATGTVAAALGVPVLSDDPAARVIAHLHGRRMLLVLDTCEHVIDTITSLAETILKSAPEVHILATSREPLRAEGEWVHRLPALESPPASSALTVEEALSYPAVTLFIERARAGADTFELDEADAPVVADICRQLDGIPLALELAAARVSLFGVRGLASGLENRLALLGKGRRTALPRQQTLRATLDWSYETLSSAEQAVLARLSVFKGRFTQESAAAVTADETMGELDVLDGVSTLTAKSLIAVETGRQPVLYRLLDTTRAYAAEKLRDRAEAPDVLGRHAAHLNQLLTRAEAEWEGGTPEDWLARYGRTLDDVRAALDWAFSPEGRLDIGVALTAASAPLWFQLSLMAEYRMRIEKALQAEGADAVAEMRLRLALGHALWHTKGPGPEMADAFARALALAEKTGSVRYRLLALWGLWSERNVFGDYPAAAALAERYAGIAAASDDPNTAVISDRMMALSLHFMGDQARALRHARRVLRSPVMTSRPSQMSAFQFDQRAGTGAVLTRILWIHGYPDQAVKVAEDSIQAARDIQHTLSLCFALYAASMVMIWVGDLPAARRHAAELTDIGARNALVFWHGWGRSYERALDLLEGRTTSAVGWRDPVCGAQQWEAMATFGMGFFAPDANVTTVGGWCEAELLRLHAVGGVKNHAGGGVVEATLIRAIALARSQQARSWELRAVTSLARLRREQGRIDEAVSLLKTAYDGFTEGRGTADHRAAEALLRDLGALSPA